MCCKHLYSTITRIELHACFTICDGRLCRLHKNLHVGVIFLCHILVMLLGYMMELNSCDCLTSSQLDQTSMLGCHPAYQCADGAWVYMQHGYAIGVAEQTSLLFVAFSLVQQELNSLYFYTQITCSLYCNI